MITKRIGADVFTYVLAGYEVSFYVSLLKDRKDVETGRCGPPIARGARRRVRRFGSQVRASVDRR